MNRELMIKKVEMFLDDIDASFYEWFAEKYIDKDLEDKGVNPENIINYSEMYDSVCEDFDEAIQTGLRIFLKLLHLPKRTIETLEVGDYIEFESGGYNEIDKINGIITSIHNDGFHIRGDYFSNLKRHSKNIKIIPHEAIELLKGVIGNE